MNRTQIYLPKSQIEALHKIAQRKKMSVSGVIRGFLKEKLEERVSLRKRYQESLFDVLERAKKLGAKGPRDLARNMDAYLYGGKK